MADLAPVRWGILGGARIARRRMAPAIRSSRLAVLHAVASRDSARAEAFRAESGAGRAYGSYRELIEDPQVEAIYTPLPNSLHAEWTIAALRAGKHVLCEKALALNAREALAMFDAAAASGRLLMEAFMWRFHPRSLRVRQMLQEGLIGNLKVCRVSFTGMMTEQSHPGNIRMNKDLGGGAMLDLGCYAVCAARWFHGVEPVRALAAGAWDPLSGIDTHLCGTLVFPGERYAMLDTTWRAWFRQEYDLLGTKGGIRVDRCFVALDGEHEILLRQGDEFKTVTVAGDDPYRLEMEHFCRAVRGQEALLYGRDDALANAAVLDALLASAAEGRPVEVSVPTPQAG